MTNVPDSESMWLCLKNVLEDKRRLESIHFKLVGGDPAEASCHENFNTLEQQGYKLGATQLPII